MLSALSLSKNSIFICSAGVDVGSVSEGVDVVEGVEEGEVVFVQPAIDKDAIIKSTTTAAAFFIMRVTFFEGSQKRKTAV